MDIKLWLEQAEGTGKVAEVAFRPAHAPKPPYITFLDSAERSGADLKNLMTTHSLTVERYSETPEYNTALEALFDAAGLEYTREQTWLPDPDDMYETIYTINTPIFERTEI